MNRTIGTVAWLAQPVICYYLAKKQGRNTIIAPALGFTFGIFATVGYAIAGDKKLSCSK